jgi:hypothetical protein
MSTRLLRKQQNKATPKKEWLYYEVCISGYRLALRNLHHIILRIGHGRGAKAGIDRV